MSLLVDAAAWTCAALAGVSIVYWIVTTRWIQTPPLHHYLHPHLSSEEQPADDDEDNDEEEEAQEAAPITFLRPLKPGVRNLEEELRKFLGELRPGDQVIFGVESGSNEEGICKRIAGSNEPEVLVVPCTPGAALNPKISKLVQMTPHARHARWLVLDAEFAAEPGWLNRFRTEWALDSAGAMTAGYRFTGARSLPQRLDVLPVLTTLWPGLAVLRRRGSLRLMLGAVMAVRRDAVERIGGWAALGDYLADDNRLGVALVESGSRVALSREVATLHADEMSWLDYWRHQRRVAVTYRACDPAGFAGSVCVHGVSLALVALCLNPGLLFAAIFAATLLVRVATVNRLARGLGFGSRFPTLAVLLSSLVESVCWALGWIRPVVTWAGRTHRVGAGGKLRGGDF